MWIYKNSIFSTKLPNNWSEFEDDSDTSAFFNVNNWSGNLRISAIKNLPFNIIYEKKEIKNRLIYSDDYIHYSEINENNIICYYWEFFKDEIYFICSFSFDISLLANKNQFKELNIVNKIIFSINLQK